ncbi:uridine kinase, partial [Streptomyces lunaelactis]|nr:uridine kinase [Streptomyces lunaelactis]
MRFEAISWERLTAALVGRIMEAKAEDGSPWLRIGVDGAPAAPAGELAGRVAEALRVRG